MSELERYEAMILESLYGLLEPDEARELAAFLETPDGAALKLKADAWKNKLSAAAKSSFPNLAFSAPPADAAATSPIRPAAAESASPRPTMTAVWARWGVAAAVVFLIGGLGIPALFQGIGWYSKSREVRKFDQIVADAKDALRAAEEEIASRKAGVESELKKANESLQQIDSNYQSAITAANKAIESKDFMVRLSGPSHAQPGAPNEWKIETLNKQGQYTLPKRMEVVVRDQNNTELLKETIDKPLAPAQLKLPAAFWKNVKPDSELQLDVVAFTDDNRKSILCQKVSLAKPVFVTHLATDKPLYQPGQTVRYRSLTLEQASFFPPENDMHLQFRLTNPDGSKTMLESGNGRVIAGNTAVLGPDRKPLRGLGVGEYTIPDSAPGGEYTLAVYQLDPRSGEKLLTERKFIVNKYTVDVFEKKLEFDAKSYGSGDTVQARIDVSRTAGGALKDAKANIVAMVDGVEAYRINGMKFDSKGVLNIRFSLPNNIGAGLGSLAVTIADGSDTEAIVRPIPIVGKILKVSFFPEGGDLIAGLDQRVYFEVRTPADKPAELKGIITDGTNKVADVSTVNDAEQAGVNRGLGVFTLKPEAGKSYFLKLERPIGIQAPTEKGFPLPEAKADGVVLTTLDPVTDRGTAIRAMLQVPTGKKTLQIGAYARGRLIDHQRVEVTAGKPLEVKLNADEKLGGVTRLTVFEEVAAGGDGKVNLVPKSERLHYRKTAESLLLTATADKMRYTPSGRVSLELGAMTEKETPAPAILMVAVVNQSVITMADNKTDRLMPTHFLLAGEVKTPAELEHADFLLTDHPKAGMSLDLLLGTQGWRRFAEQNGQAKPEDRPAVERLLVANGQRTIVPQDLYRLEMEKVQAEFLPKLEETQLRQTEAQEAFNAFMQQQGPSLEMKKSSARSALATAEDSRMTVLADLYQYETRGGQLRTMALPVFTGAVMIAGFALLGWMVVSKAKNRKPYLAGATLCLGLFALAIFGMITTAGTPQAETGYALKGKRDDRQFAGVKAAAPGRPEMAQPDGFRAEMKKDGGPEMAAMALPPGAPVMPLQGLDGPGGPGGFGGGPLPAPRMAPAKMKRGGEPAAADPKAMADDMKKLVAGRPGMPNAKIMEARDAQNRLRKQAGGAMARKNAARDIRRPGMPGGPGGGMPAAGMPGGGPAMFEMRGGELADELQVNAMPTLVREYAHERDPSLPAVRADFTETVFWHPVLVLPSTGKTTVSFQLSDDIARYQILVAGHTVDGRIGAMTKVIEARKPFTLDPKVPLEVNSNDIIDVAVRIVNDSDDRRAISYTVTPNNFTVEAGAMTTPEGFLKDSIDLAPNAKGRKIVRVRAKELQGVGGIGLLGNSDPAAEPDSIFRQIQIVPEGFPGVGTISDMLEKNFNGTVTLPKDMVPGTLKVQLNVYPTTMSDVVKGLEGMLREPGGCFEQTSTSNYPNTMILDYLKSTNQANADVSRRANDMLERGYSKLISFECPDTPTKARMGFEWFGRQDSAHEALTAYGLLQFKDMARVSKVDPLLIKRTQDFLLTRRDGKGGFQRNAVALDQFGGAPKHTTDAYITWALVESDPDDKEALDLKKEIAALKTEALDEQSTGGKDAYFLGLVANILVQRGDRDTATKILERLQTKHLKNGAITGAVTSITRSGGQALEIEATSLAVLAWIRSNEPKFAGAMKDATAWLSKQRGGYGGYGSTQSTILALKALIAYAKKTAHPAESGEISLKIAGKVVTSKKFTEQDIEVIALDVDKPETLFPAGKETAVTIDTTAKHPYPFTVTYSYTTLTPVSAEKCDLQLSAKLAKTEANEGETVPLSVSLTNKRDAVQGMSIAIIGLPAGMKVPTDMKQLIDLREKEKIAFFEIRGRELVLYWRTMKANEKIDLSIDLVCDTPGEYRGPASRGYLYYNADHKHWVEPLMIKIKPAAAE